VEFRYATVAMMVQVVDQLHRTTLGEGRPTLGADRNRFSPGMNARATSPQRETGKR
jgi:hypothetical protein